jgi:hypothetical protein
MNMFSWANKVLDTEKSIAGMPINNIFHSLGRLYAISEQPTPEFWKFGLLFCSSSRRSFFFRGQIPPIREVAKYKSNK